MVNDSSESVVLNEGVAEESPETPTTNAAATIANTTIAARSLTPFLFIFFICIGTYATILTKNGPYGIINGKTRKNDENVTYKNVKVL